MVEIRHMKNGITVIFEASNIYSTVAFGVWIKVGSKYENLQNNGISHLVEHMLFKGTEKRTPNDISKETAFLGGNINAYTSKENTSVYGRTLPEYLPQCIDLIGDMICNSVINEEELEREKGVVCEEIDMYKDSPDDYIHEKLQKIIWKDHPLGYYISGEKEVVRSFKRQDIVDFIKEHYTGENIIISVAGNFDIEETYKIIEDTFQSIPPSGIITKLSEPIYNISKFVKKKDIEQLHMNMAFRGANLSSDERYPFTILNSIIGGDVNSRLFQEIREKRGLTYSVYSYGSSFREAGLFHIYGAMNPEQGEVVYNLVDDVLENIRKNNVTSEEIADAKHQIIVEMTMNRDSIVTRMNSNAKSYLGYEKVIPFKDTIDKLNQVNLGDIDEIVKKYLVRSDMSICFAGPVDGLKNI